MKNEIDVGDIVNVYFDTADNNEYHLEVLHSPVATGDSWRFKTPVGAIIYVQLFNKMRLIITSFKDLLEKMITQTGFKILDVKAFNFGMLKLIVCQKP